MTDDAYAIWSFEHDAWWRPGRMGYTPQFAEAGHYTQADAERIVTEANRYRAGAGRRPGDRTINEQALPLATAQRYAAAGWHALTPGTYDDGRGGLHLVLEEMLAAHGYADTPENRQMLIDVAREQLGNRVQVEGE